MKNLILTLSFLAAPVIANAQSSAEDLLIGNVNDITQGVVIEGESLPIGVSIGNSFLEVEGTIGALQEFDLNERTCRGLACTYIARDSAGDQLGEVRIGFRFNQDTSVFLASSLTWTFEDWTTTAGLSLRALRDELSEDEVQAIYPAGRTIFRDTNFSSTRAISSRTDRILMRSTVRGDRVTVSGRTF